jgi:hypothetical protein
MIDIGGAAEARFAPRSHNEFILFLVWWRASIPALEHRKQVGGRINPAAAAACLTLLNFPARKSAWPYVTTLDLNLAAPLL